MISIGHKLDHKFTKPKNKTELVKARVKLIS